MNRRRLAAFIMSGALLCSVALHGQAVASPAATCSRGDSMRVFGILWTCTNVNGSLLMAAKSASQSGVAGALGSCRVGDWITVDRIRLDCNNVNGNPTWTGMRRGAAAARADAFVQSRPAALPGKCRETSWLQLTGVRLTCVTGKGARAWTGRPPAAGTALPASATAPLPPGATKSTCINAWWDKEFARAIPQLPARQDPALTDRIWEACHRSYSRVMTDGDREAAYVGFYKQLGDLVATEVQRVSATTGATPCQAVLQTLKPHFDPTFGLIGWDPQGYLPILYREWQGGPVLGKLSGNSIDCTSGGQVSVQLRRHYRPRHPGPYFPALGTPDAEWILTPEQESLSFVRAAVCLVWSPKVGNDTPGSSAQVIAYPYTDATDGINFVKADLEVTKCEFKAQQAAGQPVTWTASSSLSDMRPVTPDYAGIWHTMQDGCEWRLQPADGTQPVTWTASDGPYITVDLRAGDQFAVTCDMVKREFEQMLIAPDGMFPITSMVPGARRPSTPRTCRYTFTDQTTLRHPIPATDLTPYSGTPVEFDTRTWNGGLGKFLRGVGCGTWATL